MRLSLIVAASRNGMIGRGGQLPWHLSADLKRFRRLTTGHTIVMGRRTWESIGRPLPERRSIVISRNPAFTAPGATVVSSLDAALEAAGGDEEVFVIGGAEIYRLALPRAERLYLTRIDADFDGDTYLPGIDSAHWKLVEQVDSNEAETAAAGFPYSFLEYERVRQR